MATAEASIFANVTDSCCQPFLNSIRIEEQDGKYYVKWLCTTAGAHGSTHLTREEAEREVETLKREAF